MHSDYAHGTHHRRARTEACVVASAGRGRFGSQDQKEEGGRGLRGEGLAMKTDRVRNAESPADVPRTSANDGAGRNPVSRTLG